MSAPIGVVLAGGAATRMGGAKATALLDGRPLLHHVLRALATVSDRQAVVAKADTPLPEDLLGAERWIEPDEPRHPLTGVAHALRTAGGVPVLVVAADLALVDEPTLRILLEASVAPVVTACAGGHVHPLCALWQPAALGAVEAVLATGGPARVAVDRAGGRIVDVPDPTRLADLNTAAAVAEAERRLRGSADADRAQQRHGGHLPDW